MVDIALIHQCADPGLKPAIVKQFIARAGAPDPLAITVRSGNRVVLVPKPTTPEEALGLIRDNLGRNSVRAGITQYPAGLGIVEAGQLKPDLVDACQNIRMGTALFGRVHRIVLKWYGNPTAEEVLPQVLDDAIIAWQTGYFEGMAVFRVEPGDTGDEISRESKDRSKSADAAASPSNDHQMGASPVETSRDPNDADIRIDLSRVGIGKE